MTSAVSNLIREAKTFQIQSMMQVGKAIGMVTLNDALMDLVTRKLITPEEGYLKAIDKPGMDLTMKRAGIDPSKFAPAAPVPPAPAGVPGAPQRPSPSGVQRT